MTEEDGREIEIPENLPAQAEVDEAPLPETYERARRSLERCERVDECKDWGDKAQALVSYARQADDDELYKMARRIQGRAVRRAGELLEEFQDQGARTDREPSNGAGTRSDDGQPSTQREAAEQAGMSKRQEATARRVAEVPEEEFEEEIESGDPPSVTELAERGKGGEALTSEKPEGFRAATSLLGRLRRFAEFCEEQDAETVARAMEDHEQEGAAENAEATIEWLREFISATEV